MLSNVSYNRSQRVYEVVNPDTGELFDFPAGSDGRKEAHKASINLLNPALYRLSMQMIARHPQLESRVWKACELVLGGGVELAEQAGYLAYVQSNNEYGRYNVSSGSAGLICECEDYLQFMAPITDSGQMFCKHILAAMLMQQLNAPRCEDDGRIYDEFGAYASPAAPVTDAPRTDIYGDGEPVHEAHALHVAAYVHQYGRACPSLSELFVWLNRD